MLEKYRKTSQASKGGISMSEQFAIVPFVAQAEPVQMPKEFEPRMLAEQYGSHLLRFLYPLAKELHTTMDIRPLRTLVQTVEALVAFRDSTHGLLLTELGSHLDGLGGGGGTKRLGTSQAIASGKPDRSTPFCGNEPMPRSGSGKSLGRMASPSGMGRCQKTR